MSFDYLCLNIEALILCLRLETHRMSPDAAEASEDGSLCLYGALATNC